MLRRKATGEKEAENKTDHGQPVSFLGWASSNAAVYGSESLIAVTERVEREARL
jgi:hypothetical protein